MAKRRGVILLSGGLDSATTLAQASREGFEMHALTVDYGQRHRVELERAVAIASTAGVASHRVIEVDLAAFGGSSLTDPAMKIPTSRDRAAIGQGIPSTYVPARNTVFLSLALALAETLHAHDLFIGANAVDYSGYPDCRAEYIEAFESLANLATRDGVEGARYRVHAPLLKLGKAEIIRLAVRHGVDLARTHSCYEPAHDGRPCGACESCVLRATGFREAGLTDPGSGPRRD